ncbi:hypothetical protein BDF22DRAFT_700210 [Syncephalis plumigaleata]|nr:hypothetical protein BDF22DRAFT_700210 [Syncephalis plumigaleata]
MPNGKHSSCRPGGPVSNPFTFSLLRWPLSSLPESSSALTFGLLGAALYTRDDQKNWRFQGSNPQRIALNSYTPLTTVTESQGNGKLLSLFDMHGRHVACPSGHQLSRLAIYKESCSTEQNQWSAMAHWEMKDTIRDHNTTVLLSYCDERTTNSELHKMDTLSFKDTLRSCTFNPYIYGNTLYYYDTVFHWDSEHINVDQHDCAGLRVCCQFGLHPRVIWLARGQQLHSLDLRVIRNACGRPQFTLNDNEQLVDLTCGIATNSSLNALTTTRNIYLFDERYANRPVLTWETRYDAANDLGGLCHTMVCPNESNAECDSQPLLLRWWSSPADIMVLPLNTTEFAIPSAEAPMRMEAFSDYSTFAGMDRTNYALAHTNIRHSQDADCAPPALLGLCIDPVVLSSTSNNGDLDEQNAHGYMIHSQKIGINRQLPTPSNGNLFQQVYTINPANQVQPTLNECRSNNSVVMIDDWPKDDPNLPRVIDDFCNVLQKSLSIDDSLSRRKLEQDSMRVTHDTSYTITLYELLEKLNSQRDSKINESALWIPFPSLTTQSQDKSDANVTLDYSKESIKKMIYEQLSQDTTADSLLWSSPFYSKQSQEAMLEDKSRRQSIKTGESKASSSSSFEFQYLKPTMTEACQYRMKQQHRQPQLISEASQVLLRDWQPGNKSSVMPSHVYGTPKDKPHRVVSKGTPNKGKTTAGPLTPVPAALLPTVSNVSTKVSQSPGQKAAMPPRRIRHVAGFGKSQSASQNTMSTSIGRSSTAVNVKSERLSLSQPMKGATSTTSNSNSGNGSSGLLKKRQSGF